MCVDKASEPEKKDMNIAQTTAIAGTVSLPPGNPGLEPELQDHIGIQLRAVYNEILNEPVPDRFLKLLADLERKQAARS